MLLTFRDVSKFPSVNTILKKLLKEANYWSQSKCPGRFLDKYLNNIPKLKRFLTGSPGAHSTLKKSTNQDLEPTVSLIVLTKNCRGIFEQTYEKWEQDNSKHVH